MRAIFPIFVSAFLLVQVTLASTNLTLANNGFIVAQTTNFDYIVVILMENHPIASIYGSALAPFETSLANNYSLATNYVQVNSPSLPNYLALFSGQEFSSWSTADCTTTSPSNTSCGAGIASNLVDKLETAGLSWKAYMEDYPADCGTLNGCSPGNCYTGDGGLGNYAARHDPFVYFDDITTSSARCARIVPANSVISSSQETDDKLLSDLSSASTASNFIWLTPNTLDDMHDTSVSFGDTYLAGMVPQILNSTIFKTQKAALFVTFDEDDGSPLYATFSGPIVKTHYQSSVSYNHYSFLWTVENNWGLACLVNDCGQTAMTEFFGR